MYPMSPWAEIFMTLKSEISSWGRKRKFPTGNGSDMAVP